MQVNYSCNSKLLSEKGMECCLNGDLKKGLDIFNRGLVNDENNILLLYNKAGCLINMGEIKKAEPIFKKIIGLCRDCEKSELVLTIKANSYTYLGDFESAREIFEEILDYFPDNVDALVTRAIYLKRDFKNDDALECFDKVLELDGENFEANMYKGEILLDSGDAESKEYIDKAFELCPEFPYVVYLKGCFESQINSDYERAIGYFDEAIGLYPNFEKAYFEKGKCLVCLGKADDAKGSLRKIFELNPEKYDESRLDVLDEITTKLANHFARN